MANLAKKITGELWQAPHTSSHVISCCGSRFFILHFIAGIKSEPGSSGPASPVQGASSARASPVRSASIVPSTPPPASAHTSGSSSTENSPNIDGERGDLIEFYNKVSKESKARIITCNNLR